MTCWMALSCLSCQMDVMCVMQSWHVRHAAMACALCVMVDGCDLRDVSMGCVISDMVDGCEACYALKGCVSVMW